MKRRFWKMSGAGNDFVLLEGPVAGNASALATSLCNRRNGVGADGLLIAERSGLKLRYYNADGSAAFCGNGSRCGAWWMHSRGWFGKKKEFTFTTTEGPLRARILGAGRAAVAMPQPKLVKTSMDVDVAGRSWSVQLWETGVPHAVVVVDDLDSAPVLDAGRALRNHPAFGPKGANVDFMAREARGIAVRTYERGVEAETLACGTGAVACAAAAHSLGWGEPPVRVAVRGGDSLTVRFEHGFGGLTDAWLEGPAKICFTGETTK